MTRAADSGLVPLERRGWPAWSHWPARTLLLGLLFPIFKFLEWRGTFPRRFGRATTQRWFAAGPYEPAPNDVMICSYFKSGTN